MMRYENPEILSIIVLIVFPQEPSEICEGSPSRTQRGVNDDVEGAINLLLNPPTTLKIHLWGYFWCRIQI